MQFSRMYIACPKATFVFSSFENFVIALVGQTSEQTVQSVLQYPRSKERVGCITAVHPYSFTDG